MRLTYTMSELLEMTDSEVKIALQDHIADLVKEYRSARKKNLTNHSAAIQDVAIQLIENAWAINLLSFDEGRTSLDMFDVELILPN